jgi:hypothetical protein
VAEATNRASVRDSTPFGTDQRGRICKHFEAGMSSLTWDAARSCPTPAAWTNRQTANGC